MENLSNEIITFLKTLTFSTDVSVRPAQSKQEPSYPMITVQEINNSTRLLLHGIEKFANIGYDINIFSKDMYPFSGVVNCQMIANIVNTELQIKYGFKRQSYNDMSDIKDKSVHRLVMRYDGVLDTVNNYIYQ